MRNQEEKDIVDSRHLQILRDALGILNELHPSVTFLKNTFKEFRLNEETFTIECIDFNGYIPTSFGITLSDEFILVTYKQMPATQSLPQTKSNTTTMTP